MRAFGTVLLGLSNGHTCSRGLVHVKRRAIAAEYLHRRPFRQHRDRWWCVRRKFVGGVNNFSTDDGEHRFNPFDLFLRHKEIVVGERDEIG